MIIAQMKWGEFIWLIKILLIQLKKETMEVINEIRDDKNADILMLLVLSFVKGIKFGASSNERKIA